MSNGLTGWPRYYFIRLTPYIIVAKTLQKLGKKFAMVRLQSRGIHWPITFLKTENVLISMMIKYLHPEPDILIVSLHAAISEYDSWLEIIQ